MVGGLPFEVVGASNCKSRLSCTARQSRSRVTCKSSWSAAPAESLMNNESYMWAY